MAIFLLFMELKSCKNFLAHARCYLRPFAKSFLSVLTCLSNFCTVALYLSLSVSVVFNWFFTSSMLCIIVSSSCSIFFLLFADSNSSRFSRFTCSRMVSLLRTRMFFSRERVSMCCLLSCCSLRHISISCLVFLISIRACLCSLSSLDLSVSIFCNRLSTVSFSCLHLAPSCFVLKHLSCSWCLLFLFSLTYFWRYYVICFIYLLSSCRMFFSSFSLSKSSFSSFTISKFALSRSVWRFIFFNINLLISFCIFSPAVLCSFTRSSNLVMLPVLTSIVAFAVYVHSSSLYLYKYRTDIHSIIALSEIWV